MNLYGPSILRPPSLVSLVEHGLLQLRYPDKPNRTDQAYKATCASSDSHQ
jgi:hypothetical protein